MNSFKRGWRSRLASVSRFCPSSLWSLSSKCRTGHTPREWLQERMEKVGVTSVFMTSFGKEAFKFLSSVHGNGVHFFLMTCIRGERRRRWENGGQPLLLRPFLSPLSVQTTQHRVGREASSKPTTYLKILSSAEDCLALYPSKV